MSYNTEFQNNNTELQEILDTINALPEAGSGEPTLQEKSVTPTKSAQEVVADDGYDGLSKVSVGAIPNEYIVPSGTKSITTNGTHDVTANASVSVNVPVPSGYIKPSGTKNITSNGTHNITQYASVNVNVPVPSGYINTNDADATAADILSGKTAYVKGVKIIGTMPAGGGGGGDISLETCEVIVDTSNLMAPEMGINYSTLRDGHIEYDGGILNMGDVVTITVLKNTMIHACATAEIICTGGLTTVYSTYSEEGVYSVTGDGMLICY